MSAERMTSKGGRAEGKSTKSRKGNEEMCSICCQKFTQKDEVLFCSGNCQKYLHRYCAGVGEDSYKALTSDGASPFFCFCCYKAQKDEQVAVLLKMP